MLNRTAQRIAGKTQEVVAENEGVPLDNVHVEMEMDRNGVWEPIITVETENGTYRARWSDGESYSDLQVKWEEI